MNYLTEICIMYAKKLPPCSTKIAIQDIEFAKTGEYINSLLDKIANQEYFIKEQSKFSAVGEREDLCKYREDL